MINTILWDWNGTLLDDVQLVVDVNNRVFTAYGLPPTTVEKYRSCFRFPIREYYRDLGVTDDIFDEVAHAWYEGFLESFPGCPLHKEAVEAAKTFKAAGYRQVIISASKVDALREQVASYPELDGLFDDVLGLDNIYAASKVALAKGYMAAGNLSPDTVLFLGDTTHDAEVAAAIGCSCLLISGGHQPDAVLRQSGCQVVRDCTEAVRLTLSGFAESNPQPMR